MKTFVAKKKEIKRKWYLLDAKDQILGKIAVVAANILRGKNKVDLKKNKKNISGIVVTPGD